MLDQRGHEAFAEDLDRIDLQFLAQFAELAMCRRALGGAVGRAPAACDEQTVPVFRPLMAPLAELGPMAATTASY